MILSFFNPAKNIMSPAVCGSMSRLVLLKEIAVRHNINEGVSKLVFHSWNEGITDNLMLHFRLLEKMCFVILLLRVAITAELY